MPRTRLKLGHEFSWILKIITLLNTAQIINATTPQLYRYSHEIFYIIVKLQEKLSDCHLNSHHNTTSQCSINLSVIHTYRSIHTWMYDIWNWFVYITFYCDACNPFIHQTCSHFILSKIGQRWKNNRIIVRTRTGAESWSSVSQQSELRSSLEGSP